MSVPRLVVERAVDTFSYKASAALLAQTYNAKVRGTSSANVGLVPGAILRKNTVGNELILADGAGPYIPLGMLVTSPNAAYPLPSTTGGYAFQFAENANIAVLPFSDSVIEVEAYLSKAEGSSTDLVYAAGDLLFRSIYGFLTNDDATQADVFGQVLEVLANGNLRVQLFRSATAAPST
jgi:hypothetical protein